MATNPTYVRLVSQADIPVTRIGVAAATSLSNRTEPVVIAETGQIAILNYTNAVAVSAYIPPGDTDTATAAGPVKTIPFTPRVAGETAAGRYATDGTVALWVPLTGAPGTLVDIVVLADVLTTNDGTHCWTATFAIVHTDNTTTDVVGAVTTTTTPDTLTVLPSVVAEPHVWIATDKAIICTITKTSTPGALAIGAWLKYQDTPA
jgi:hypothetical protein